jgi:hypothetical protein
VEHSAFLGEVYLLPAEHGGTALRQAALPRQLEQQLEGLIGHPIFGVIKEQTSGLNRQARAAFGVSSEQFAKGQGFDFLMMRRQGFPGWPGRESFGSGCHARFPVIIWLWTSG